MLKGQHREFIEVHQPAQTNQVLPPTAISGHSGFSGKSVIDQHHGGLLRIVTKLLVTQRKRRSTEIASFAGKILQLA